VSSPRLGTVHDPSSREGVLHPYLGGNGTCTDILNIVPNGSVHVPLEQPAPMWRGVIRRQMAL